MTEMTDRLRLLGGFELTVAGEPVAIKQPRLREFVAYLAAHSGETFSRIQIAYRFWPDSSEGQARTNTRQLIFKLNQAWGDITRLVYIDDETIAWRADAQVTIDVHSMRELVTQADEAVAPVAKSSLLEQAADTYQGDFLPDCFNDWALAVREQVNSQYSALLLKLVDVLIELREYERALTRGRQLIEHDPVQEVAYRRLMQVHVALGDRAAALRVYHSCASMLQKELGVEPSPATMRMRATLLQADEAETPLLADAPRAVERPRLVGRHREWQRLKQAWSEAQQGNAQSIFVWGEAGIGKTRLAEELIDWVRHQGHIAVSSRSYAAEGALTYAPITEWLKFPAIEPVVRSVDDLWQVELARLLPELLIENGGLPAPGPLTESWQQQRFYQSIVQVFQAVPRPLLLHLDDMQWADHETLMLLHFLLHNTRDHPLLLLGTIRSEDAVDNAALHELAETLRHARQLSELVLAALTKEEAAQLAELTAGKPLSSDRNEALFENSEGHPLYLIESLRSEEAAETAPVRHTSPRTSPVTLRGISDIPPRIFQLLSARLNQLSPDAQLVASAASVIGHSFTYTVLKEVTEMEEAPLVDVLDELWTRRIIREQEDESYDFSHDRIREVAYQQISRTRRRMLHRTVAQSLETLYAQNLDAYAGELARHFANAGESRRAYEYYRQSANIALEQYALARADELFNAALEHVPNDAAERIMTLSEQNIIYHYILDFPRLKSNVDEQIRLLDSLQAPEPALSMEVYLDKSKFYSEQNSAEEAAKAAHIAFTYAERLGTDDALARTYLALGRSYWMQSSMAEATNFYGLSIKFAHRAGNREIESISAEFRAATGMFSGMPAEEILARITYAYQLATEADDKQRMASLRNKFGYLHIAQGNGEFEEAEQEYRIALELAVGIRDRAWEETILGNLGMLFVRRGDYRQAMPILTDAQRLSREGNSFWHIFATEYHVGTCWMEMGCLDQAKQELTDASDHLQALGNRHFETKARADLGLALYLAGEFDLAEKELWAVLELAEKHGDLRFEGLVRTRLGYVYEAMGQLADANDMYERGYALHSQMEQHYYALNSLAGSARVARRTGNIAVADDLVETIWQAIEGKSTDATVETAMTLRTCYQVFAENDDPRQYDVVRMAWDQLRRRAESIDASEYRNQFWQLAPHAFFREVAAEADMTTA